MGTASDGKWWRIARVWWRRDYTSELYIYWNDNCGSNFEANMAEIEARLVGMIQAPTRIFTQFRMKNFKNRH